ncbi:peptidoglycan-binding domain-containing protein [Nannocystis radixulma]|uniref:Peptidoglycan-binding domain-containing protein n=1 Tax=Nannocystis radixulma TaxID=2995305 RepID=A0ABT5AZE5_9BACT|nr:peptidoglycan-binding domain-containing protein [Nannocystis radixulma]MDC0666322.1 peptidoglycan-binding domain-containing protein [Nannocystis radixulma]
MAIRYVIRDGDSLARLAEEHGLFADTVWRDDANAELRARRPAMDQLCAGDVVIIPVKRDKSAECATDQVHRFRRCGVPARVRVQVLDAWQQPLADRPYRLEVGGTVRRGKTDALGVLCEYVPAIPREGVLWLGADERIRVHVRFGGLDPVDEPSGVRQRLRNLGIALPGGSNPSTEQMARAVATFQRRVGLEPAGQLDASTRDALEQEHDVVTAEDAEVDLGSPVPVAHAHLPDWQR